jgi:hypothetical protein
VLVQDGKQATKKGVKKLKGATRDRGWKIKGTEEQPATEKKAINTQMSRCGGGEGMSRAKAK